MYQKLKRLFFCFSDSSFINSNGFEYFQNCKLETSVTLEETMELISESISANKNYFGEYVDGLKSQVVQLEEEIYRKSAKIENLQLYNSEKLKIINSLIAALNEAEWKRDTMQRICEEHAPNKLYKSMMLVSRVSNKMSEFKSNRDILWSCMNSLEANNDTLRDALGKLVSNLDECIGVVDKAASRELSDALFDEKQFNGTVKNIINDFRHFQSSAEDDGESQNTVAIVDRNGGCGERNNLENLIELWEVVKDLSQSNQYLANRVASMNMHKVSLQYQLDEMESNTKELELKTIIEIEEVEKKQEILNQNESMIQQHWDELNTSQEIVVQTHRAQEIDQELEDLHIEYDT